jgi:hypothetical protein
MVTSYGAPPSREPVRFFLMKLAKNRTPGSISPSAAACWPSGHGEPVCVLPAGFHCDRFLAPRSPPAAHLVLTFVVIAERVASTRNGSRFKRSAMSARRAADVFARAQHSSMIFVPRVTDIPA